MKREIGGERERASLEREEVRERGLWWGGEGVCYLPWLWLQIDGLLMESQMLFLLVLAFLVCCFSAMGCAWAYREYQRQEGWRPRPDWADRPPQSARFCAGEQSAGPKEGAPGGPPAASGPGRPGPPAGDPALIPGAWPSAAPANEAGLGLGAPPRPPSRSGGPPPPPPAGPIRPRTGAPVGVGR